MDCVENNKELFKEELERLFWKYSVHSGISEDVLLDVMDDVRDSVESDVEAVSSASHA